MNEGTSGARSDDFDEAALLYGLVEELVLATLEADDVARLSNLWTTLAVGVRNGLLLSLIHI